MIRGLTSPDMVRIQLRSRACFYVAADTVPVILEALEPDDASTRDWKKQSEYFPKTIRVSRPRGVRTGLPMTAHYSHKCSRPKIRSDRSPTCFMLRLTFPLKYGPKFHESWNNSEGDAMLLTQPSAEMSSAAGTLNFMQVR